MSRVPVLDVPATRAAVLPTRLVCAGCGFHVADDTLALRCPLAQPGDDIDHVIRRELDTTRLQFPVGHEPNPFIRYRTLLHAYHRARRAGWSDGGFVRYVEGLDRAVAHVDGGGFCITPLLRSPALDAALGFSDRGGVVVKDETGNVSGSHKARHLFGALLELEVDGGQGAAPLAIASCGNAALAAAIVARAAGRRLLVFIPTDADPGIVARLRSLEAEVTVCPRRSGMPGDPTYARLREAVDGGAVAFTCQGNENGLAIEGGETLGYELVSALAERELTLDRLMLQVGGGALASACWQSLAEALALGTLSALPRLHAVQTEDTFPLHRAYHRVVAHLVDRLEIAPGDEALVAERLRDRFGTEALRDELEWVARHRSAFMWPWEHEPHSIAGGILDDETYDWFSVVEGMLATGGWPVLVDEPALVAANELAVASTGIDVDPTGSAGLAGLLSLHRTGRVARDEMVGVIFTGIRRGSGGPAAARHTSS